MSVIAIIATALLATAPVTSHQHAPHDLFAAQTSPVMSGPQLPYTGKFRIKKQDKFTLCIAKRESNLHWYSTNRANGYFGAFQFNDALKRGATWMMIPELTEWYGHKMAVRISAKLRKTEMHKWTPFYQHMAFDTILNWRGPGSGEKHWAGGRFACGRA